MPGAGAKWRAAWDAGAIQVPGAFNALTAKMAERLGFGAVYFSGGALSAGWAGVPDVGLLSLKEFADEISAVARATKLPLLADADTGFGEPINAARTVQFYEDAGAAGLHLEDQVLPKRCGHLSGKSVIPTEAMVLKIRAAVQARRDPDFVIVARTDARAAEGWEAALKRALAYVAAGADAIFPEALENEDEFARFARECPVPVIANMTEFGKSPLLDFATLSGMGYRAVIYPLTAFRAAMHAAEATLAAVREEGHQRGQIDKMQTRERLYQLIDYNDWEERDRALFKNP
jgi:methylisocitrate lyase